MISSTCFDFKEERATIKTELDKIGYQVILSEARDFAFNPEIHTHTSCLRAVKEVDAVIFLIGDRFGGKAVEEALSEVDFKELEDSDIDFFKSNKKLSITQCEILTAIKNGIPVFSFIRKEMSYKHKDYEEMKKVGFPSNYPYSGFKNLMEAQYIFEFYNYVRKRSIGNFAKDFEYSSEVATSMKEQLMAWFSRLISERKSMLLGATNKTEVLPAQVVTHRDVAREKIFNKLFLNLQKGITVRVMGTGVTNFLQNEDQIHAILQEGNNIEILLINNQIVKSDWQCTSDDFINEARETLLQDKEAVNAKEFKIFCPLANLNFLIDSDHFNNYHSRKDYNQKISKSIDLIKEYQQEFHDREDFGNITAKHFNSFVPLSITALHKGKDQDNELIAEFILPFSKNRIIFHSSHDDNPNVYELFMGFFEDTWAKSTEI